MGERERKVTCSFPLTQSQGWAPRDWDRDQGGAGSVRTKAGALTGRWSTGYWTEACSPAEYRGWGCEGPSSRIQEGRNTRIEEERGSKEGQGGRVRGQNQAWGLGSISLDPGSWQENVECGGFPLCLTPHCSLEPHLLLLRCCQK